jgi:hypothetical protein
MHPVGILCLRDLLYWRRRQTFWHYPIRNTTPFLPRTVRLGHFIVSTCAQNARVIRPFFVFHFATLSIDAAGLPAIVRHCEGTPIRRR